MANIPGVILETGQGITVSLPTVRVPELTRVADIADDDIFPLFDVSENQTKAAGISDIRDKLIGQGVPTTPVLNTGIVQLVVDDIHAGSMRWDLPQLAGKNFSLDRRPTGQLLQNDGLVANHEYEVLSTGGFLLTGPSTKMRKGETFILHLTQLQGGEGGIIENSGSTIVNGMVTIVDNATWSDSHKKKLIAISGGAGADAKKITYTLPDITTAPENLVIPIETNINNKYQSTVAAKSGQLIYFNGRSYSSIYMGIGENLWVLMGVDGWYVISSYGNYQSAGEIIPSYRADKLNTVIAMGQILKRDEYPRLWQEVQGFGAALVADDQRGPGLWTTGDGMTTFRVPDLRAMFIRGLDRGAGLDTDRINAIGGSLAMLAGSYQPPANGPHVHGYPQPLKQTNTNGDGAEENQGAPGWTLLPSRLGNNGTTGTNTGDGSGSDTRPANIAMYYLIVV